MSRSRLTELTLVVLLSGSVQGADKDKNDKDSARPANVTLTKIDTKKGEITVSYKDDKGKAREKTFQLTRDVRLLDETGRVVDLAVFESGNEALLVETEGQVRELRRMYSRSRTRSLSDAVRTLIETTEGDAGGAEDLQKIYDMLRKLDTDKNGKIDTRALKAEAENIVQERVKEVFTRLDTNKDGKISKEEARGLIKDHFDRIDANKDGFLDIDELLKAAKERHATKPADDKAPDGKPTGKEKN